MSKTDHVCILTVTNRQPPNPLNASEHQSPTYLTWKQPTTVPDAPPPYSETPNQPVAENEEQETTSNHSFLKLCILTR